MPSNHLILCCPLLHPSIFASIKVFSNESVLHIRWPKYWSFSFSIIPSTLLPVFNDWFFGIFYCSVWFGDLGHLISFQFVSPPCCCCCCWVAKLYLTVCNLMGCSTPGFPVPHYILEFAQTHIHRVGDAIQPSHLLLLSSVFTSIREMSQLFASGGQNIGTSA